MEDAKIVEKIRKGRVFIYPTDTVYGLGCDASKVESVRKIKGMKGRDADKPLSVIAPSIEWIEKNLIVDVDLSKYLPGPYTVVLKKKYKGFLSEVSGGDSLGVRIPDCEFTSVVQKSGRAFVTTSVNLSGEDPAVKIDDVPLDILEKVDEVIDVGELNGKVSILVIDGKEVERG
jgi:L-threonylcarbamoyladenylate synthase|tara:strand:- start:2123 stop:2644 length:522 start_codon:yes stop_codon:yes gene_type:complete